MEEELVKNFAVLLSNWFQIEFFVVYSFDDPYLRESYKHYTQELLHDHSMSRKLTNTYWTAKSVVKKLKKKEDESVVAADSDLDAKLEVFPYISYVSYDEKKP